MVLWSPLWSPGFDPVRGDDFGDGPPALLSCRWPARTCARRPSSYSLAVSPSRTTVSFWPKLYFGFITVSASGSGTGTTSSGENATAIGTFVPFMFGLARHFLLGIAPVALTAAHYGMSARPGPAAATTCAGAG